MVLSTTLRQRLTCLVSLAVLLFGAQASAQDQFSVQNFHPQPARWMNFFSVASARVLESGQWEAGLFMHYADDPLVLVDPSDERVLSVVASQLVVNVLGSVGIADVFEIGIDVPLIPFQEAGNDDLTEIGLELTDPGFGIGDIRLVPKVLFLTTQTESDPSGLSFGMLINAWLPTGDQDVYQGEGFRMEPRLTLDYVFPCGVEAGVNLGYLIREENIMENLEVDDQLMFGVATNVPLIEDTLYVLGELYGGFTMAADSMDAEEIPLEGILGFRATPLRNLFLELGGGTGFIEGAGAPDYRLLFSVGYNSGNVGDRDGDGLLDDVDACPDDPEDFDGWEDEDGCPDPDNDQDGILDVVDECPNNPEDFDDWEDEDGCPDPDNDQDGILDVDDACPNDPEDFDNWEDEDGCPDIAITVTCERIEFNDRVYFEFDRDVIQERSYPLLNQIAEVIESRPDLLLVRIEGHTDNYGSDEYNLDLSDRRAAAVLAYMTGRGIVPDRLTSEGFGESRPISTNETNAGRAENRRVEFIIVEQEGCLD